ncbi:hypothetical protein IGI04_035795 [Brassica rapa subsp. trilocularis]|uniref:Uncharacterized protein n=1 Tax=Brassica rapa subsp. trilocularis TaxID=1813537 RepID=A0ABQ7LFE3_BRACM|nr:hypothetical protein IGI04_035795 [Brassica rapa subsp. trilocularis]
MVLVKEQRHLEALIESLKKDLQVEKEETRQACIKLARSCEEQAKGCTSVHQHESQTGAGTRKETDWYIRNCAKPRKKQQRMCCWFYGKVGHKKVECFAREKSRKMAKKVNKTFTKPKRVEEVSLAKSVLLDEIKKETSEEGCNSGRSDLEVDQGASSLEPGHEVVCGTKGKEIEVRQEVMREDLQEADSEITLRQ